MITEQGLQEAIAECQGERYPDANTCMKLAAFYIIKNELFGKPEQFEKPVQAYSELPPPVQTVESPFISYSGDSEFAQAINNRQSNEIWAIMDELMLTLEAINPRLYDGVMRKINE